jgi:3-methyladenine DNA glycosylase/8-oxoguanine DNA glycosylase
MSKMVASERGLSVSKIRTDSKYAERATAIHLTYLFLQLNDWREVAKAWRAGLNGRKKQYAIDYAQRVENYGKYYQ